jgi:hypothetical protein
MTPNDIEILIHCYVSLEKHPRAEYNRGVFDSFVENGLVSHVKDGIYRTTEKGVAHIQQLCNLPLPTKQFIGYDGKVIKYI